MNKRIKTITMLTLSNAIVLTSLITIKTNNEKVLTKANAIEYQLVINTHNAPKYGEGEFFVKTNDGNTIWFAYRNFGIDGSSIALKKNGYLKNLTPINGVKHFTYDQKGTWVQSYMDASFDTIGAWYDGCKAYNVNYQVKKSGIDGASRNWSADYEKEVTFISWKDPSTLGWPYVKCDNIKITYTC